MLWFISYLHFQMGAVMRRMAAERPPLILSKIHFAGWPYSTLLPGPWAAADGLCWHTSRESHPSEDLSELPPLLVAVAGQEYHYWIAGEGRAGLPRSPAAMRNSPPQAALWTDGHRSAPFLAVFNTDNRICTGGLGASSSVASALLLESLSSADVSRCRI